MKTSKTSRPLTVYWKGYATEIPEGHKVHAMECPTVASGVLWVADPNGLHYCGPIERHDATHYGISIPASAVLGATCQHQQLARQCEHCFEVREAVGIRHHYDY